MTDRNDLDRVRDVVAGLASADDRAAVAARLRDDPTLADFARDLQSVVGAGEETFPTSTVTFDSLALDTPEAERGPAEQARGGESMPGRAAAADGNGPPASSPSSFPALRLRRWAPLAVAAGIAVAVGAYLWTRPSGATNRSPIPDRSRIPDRSSIVVASLTLDAAETSPPPLPPSALDYAPAGPAGLRFVEKVADARSLASLTGRPLVVFVHHPSCPMCIELEKTTFREPAVGASADRFVLSKVDVTKADGRSVLSDLKGLKLEWPVFVVYAPDGKRVGLFSGMQDADAMRASLDAVATPRETAAPWATVPWATVPWTTVHEVARSLGDAAAAGDVAARERALAAAGEAAKAATGTPLETRVRAASRASGVDAGRAVAAARELAGAGKRAEALASLDAAIERHRGAPQERELSAIRARFAKDGRFPAVEGGR